ncbi:uncharacterized protein LOC130679614 [Manis pentadactyla]|uniref:uncharacterized protein LOC130679614 n=1 Tax=Manis pentadactyla TaxID=143292 RepID=UPI00255C904D|nr:uncharacterized protein LOC130679614 [Manis pentadactyla]
MASPLRSRRSAAHCRRRTNPATSINSRPGGDSRFLSRQPRGAQETSGGGAGGGERLPGAGGRSLGSGIAGPGGRGPGRETGGGAGAEGGAWAGRAWVLRLDGGAGAGGSGRDSSERGSPDARRERDRGEIKEIGLRPPVRDKR